MFETSFRISLKIPLEFSTSRNLMDFMNIKFKQREYRHVLYFHIPTFKRNVRNTFILVFQSTLGEVF